MAQPRNIMKSLRVKNFLQVDGTLVGSGPSNTPGDVYYVDGNKSASGDGKTWGGAFATITEGITALNSSSNKNSILYIGEGYYIEAAGVTLSANDCTIVGLGNGADAVVWFGTGTTGTVDAATDDLLTITGNNNKFVNMGFYVHKDTKCAIVLDDTGGASTASFNEFIDCNFTREAANGQSAGIKFLGGNYNRIEGCVFTASSKDAGIIINSQTGNPSQNVIRGCEFTGIAYAIDFGAVGHNTLIDRNFFMTGSLSGDAMTAAIETTGAGAAYILVTDNYTDLSAADLVVGTGSAVSEISNHTS